jgi:hypothetical protein
VANTRRELVRKIAVVPLIAVAILLSPNLSVVWSSNLQSFYNDYVTSKITNCKRIASDFGNCRNQLMFELARTRALQAQFYEIYRADLVNTMVVNGVGKKCHRIDYFLITQFKNASSGI